jgi:hypothetical protein
MLLSRSPLGRSVALDPIDRAFQQLTTGMFPSSGWRNGPIVHGAWRGDILELTVDLPLLPQSLVNVRTASGFDWTSHGPLTAASRAVEQELAGRGRVLIRASGTEPVLRVMVEAEESDLAQALAGPGVQLQYRPHRVERPARASETK